MSSLGVASVETYTNLLEDLLRTAQVFRPGDSVDPVLRIEDFDGGIEKIGAVSPTAGHKSYAAIETACRNTFYSLLAETSARGQGLGQLWNLFDILSSLSDLEYCEPGLAFWLVEELLDSQTIDGCRIVFDYLDSRRELLTAKHFKQKSLIILRACNELLRRLSRAEDTVFCGRVFIFLFQSFPLGDRSSVNLRGEFHVENATTYEVLKQNEEIAKEDDGMDVDRTPEAQGVHEEAADGTNTSTAADGKTVVAPSDQKTKAVKFESEKARLRDEVPDMDTLYTMFWSLQEFFSQPTRLFEEANLSAFKTNLHTTMSKFKQVHQDQQARGNTRQAGESTRGIKRKRNGQADELAGTFNPKYLTSRDLFDLEISDLAFRRHILVQSLILIDFLLSLSPKAKKKLETSSNKSVLYGFVLNEDNTKWATAARNDIALYLQQGPEGKFYYRMVDTVLSRDKNWVHWKAEGCPPIARKAVTAAEYGEAEKSAQKACTNKRIRPNAMGALDLKFLSEDKSPGEMEKYKDPTRYTIPTIDSFKGPIAEDEFDMEMAKDEDAKQAAVSSRASKLWRTLRIASRSRLNVFDKIEDGNNLKPLFEPEEHERPASNGPDENKQQFMQAPEVSDGESKTMHRGADGEANEITIK